MLSAMRRFALCLAPFLFFGCPGTNTDLSVPDQDADNDPPDAAVEAEAGPVKPLKVLTLNTLNFFNDKDDSNDPLAEEIVSAAEYQQHLAAVSGILTQLDPDVAILQEVENQAVVDDVAAQVGGYAHTAITEGNDPRGIDIAVLSKHPFQVAPSHKGEFFQASSDPSQTFTFSRDVLEVHMIFNQRHVALLGIHYKANDSDPESDVKRLAEAERTREIVTGIHYDDPSTAIVVLGDFNCAPGSDPMNALLGTPPIKLASATASMPESERWSVNFGGVHQLYDDQIANENAAAMVEPGSVQIPHGLNDGSDHDPVIVTYLVN
jgi:endonuclease/exonuclease/phosphatase family metal-dependent hydrolase